MAVPGHVSVTSWGRAGESRKQRAAAAAAEGAAGDQPPLSASEVEAALEEGTLVYDEFESLPMAQAAARPRREFATFDAALDEFFSKATHALSIT